MTYVSLPQRLLYNGCREEFSAIMSWLYSIGEIDMVWHYYPINHLVEFVHESDATAFKLRFGL